MSPLPAIQIRVIRVPFVEIRSPFVEIRSPFVEIRVPSTVSMSRP